MDTVYKEPPPAPLKIRDNQTGPLVIVILGLLTALVPLSVDLYLPALPELARELGASASAAQTTVAISFLGLGLGQLFHGPFSDRVGRRVALFGGVSVFVLASIGCALTTNIGVFLTLRLLQAMGGCAGVVVARAIVRDRFAPRDSVKIYSMLVVILSISPVFAPLVGGAILLVADWRIIFWLLAALGVVLLAAAAFFITESRSPETAELARRESPLSSYRALLGQRNVVGFALIGAFAGATLATYVSSSPAVLIGGYGISPQAFGWFFGANGLGMVLANIANARLSKYFPPEAVLRIANRVLLSIALIMLICAITGFGGMWGVLIPLFFALASLSFNQPNALAGAMAQDPRRAGSAAALVGASQFGVGSVCGMIAGAFVDGSATPMAAVISCSALISVLLFMALRPTIANAPKHA